MSENELPDIVKYWMERRGETPKTEPEIVTPEEAELLLDSPKPVLDVNGMPAVFPAMQKVLMVRIHPELDEAVVILSEQCRSAVGYANTLTIVTVEDDKRVVRDMGAVAGLRKKLEALRLEYTDPLTKLSRQINDQFKDITIPLKEADDILRGKDKAFNDALDALRDAAETAERLRLIAEQEQAALTGEIIESKPGSILTEPTPNGTMRVETGTRHWRDNPKWALLDLDAVPREYMKLDEVKINAAVKGGADKIPGLKIWSEREAVVRSRED